MKSFVIREPIVSCGKQPCSHNSTLMNASYFYWSIARPDQTESMEKCVRSAREVGVFTDFHIVTSTPLTDCHCYQSQATPTSAGLEALVYLKGGFSKLSQSYAVWVSPETRFRRAPRDLLSLLRSSPIHVPLRRRQDHNTPNRTEASWVIFETAMRKGGVYNAVYQCDPSLWIVKLSALNTLFKLATEFSSIARGSGSELSLPWVLSYAMQMLCANPRQHCIGTHPEVWLPVQDAWNLIRTPDADGQIAIQGHDGRSVIHGDPALVSTLSRAA